MPSLVISNILEDEAWLPPPPGSLTCRTAMEFHYRAKHTWLGNRNLATASLERAAPEECIVTFAVFMSILRSPPGGDASLVRRAYKIGESYGCSRYADAVYIALAEGLANTRVTVLLSFDPWMPNQANKNAPAVNVQILTI